MKLFGKKIKIDKSRFIKAVIETVVVWSLTIWLFIVCKDVAEYERGYSAFGAEYLAFGLALIWYILPHDIKRKEPASSANDTSSKEEKFVYPYYHEIEEVSSDGEQNSLRQG